MAQQLHNHRSEVHRDCLTDPNNLKRRRRDRTERFWTTGCTTISLAKAPTSGNHPEAADRAAFGELLMETALTPLEFARRARKLYPEREAVVDNDQRFTYA